MRFSAAWERQQRSASPAVQVGFLPRLKPWASSLTLCENVAFGEHYHEDTRDPDELLESLGVSHLAERSPPTLSGGEQQRVALARSLAVRPDAMLLDEPLSALDVPTRQSLRDDLAEVLAHVTSVYVTHNRTTARAIADRIAVMRDGKIVQTGTPDEIFESPTTAYVAQFVGANVLPASRFDRDAEAVAIRPEHVEINPPTPETQATVKRVAREDAASRVVLDWDGERVEAFSTEPPTVGATVEIRFPDEDITELGN
ncbi:ABC transporter ATP-binding protein [Natronomonas sp. EA1]|uniref:ABC transporter ATP-binding protein n=1 Tax=Natronomonas sp. EA1 TaxID=3421655 RepID=UPI003EBB6AA3